MIPASLAAVGFTPEQRLWLLGAWVLLFLLPAFWVRSRAKRDGEAWGKWFVLTLLTSVIGVVEYFEHKAVLRRRAKREARAQERERERREARDEREP